MKILACDLALKSGWAFGDRTSNPISGSVRFIGPQEAIEDLPVAVVRWTRDKILEYHPDMIILESYLSPSAQPSEQGVIVSLFIHGVVMGIAGIYGVPVVSHPVQEWRKHFCGRATANPARRPGKVRKTTAEKNADRIANKQMVLDRAKLLGYLPQMARDFDRSDALGVWDFAQATYGRAVPRELVLFGETDAK